MAIRTIDKTIYNGRHHIVFNPFNNRKRYTVNGDVKPGTTTVIGQVIAKPGLMLWPLNTAMTHLKKKCPNITLEDLEFAANIHNQRKDKGADVGTVVHDLSEALLLGQEVDLEGQSAEAKRALNGFKNWFLQAGAIVETVEGVVYSQELDYAGTYDHVLTFPDGKTYLTDLKTTNASDSAPEGVYAENFVQLGSYALAYEEQRIYEEANGGSLLKKLDDLMIISCKKDGKVHTRAASELGFSVEDCMQLWREVFHLYKSLKELKFQLGGR